MTEATATPTSARPGAAAKAVLVTLAAAQFVMILDSSVMNVSIATVAKDLDTTVTGIQTAITLYTLVGRWARASGASGRSRSGA